MCGRFVNLTKINSIKKKFNIISDINNDFISYNVAPSQNFFIIYKDKEIKIDNACWGYSFFDKKQNYKKNIFNSRIETIREKILFKDSFFKRKCILSTNGYFEWSIIDGKKIPFFIHIPPNEQFYLAGVWKYADYKENKKKVFTIITKNSNSNIQNIHSRMPVILSFEESIEYLNNDNSYDLKYNTVSVIENELDFYPVSNFVNNPLNNTKNCIKQF